jgi:1-acyl-sn-glycerol-3-phosphate acyltransferase
MSGKYQVQPSIPAAKNAPGEEVIYRLMVRPALWNMFSRVWVQVHGRLPRRDEGPLICYLNHPSWWDGYMIAVIHRKLLRSRFRLYIMMEERQLREFRFFTWSGAFSINPDNRLETARSLRYISRLLREQRNRSLYIFPQGHITPNDRRPLELFPGAASIARHVGHALLCPVALRYEFRGAQHPEAFIRFGPLHRVEAPVDVDALTREITHRLTDSADTLRDAVLADDMGNFRPLLHGRPGIDRLFSTALRWAKGLRSDQCNNQ